MLIESLIRREGGTTVTLGDTTYKFVPPTHVCDVADPEHIEHLLAISDGFRVADGYGDGKATASDGHTAHNENTTKQESSRARPRRQKGSAKRMRRLRARRRRGIVHLEFELPPVFIHALVAKGLLPHNGPHDSGTVVEAICRLILGRDASQIE